MRYSVLIILLVVSFAEKNYTEQITNINSLVKNSSGLYHHRAYNRLAYFSDTFGPRLWGSDVLELAINDLKRQADEEGFDNVRLEPVTNFTKWIRGEESLILQSPRQNYCPLKVIGLGWSVPCNVTAEVIVVKDFDELEQVKDQVKGKIVVYDEPWTTYGQTVAYRSRGASSAAKYGAVAALIRSVTPDSIESVHAGAMTYDPAFPKICTAAIAIEDADMFRRMQNRNQTIVLSLSLQPSTGIGNSNNLVFEIKGSQFPEQILLLGGHIDSWDTGSQTGANDDGGGFMTVFEALRLLKMNGLIPKRTLRFIAWSGQEFGGVENGAHQYAKTHESEMDNHILAFENDLGSSTLLGFGIQGSKQGLELLKNITRDYLTQINITVANTQGEAADTEPLFNKGIPVMANIVNDTMDHKFYFTYHHTGGDSMTMMNPDDMDSNVIGIAAVFYILADLDVTVQRDPKVSVQ